MKSPGRVKHQINQVRFRHLEKRLQSELRRSPSNCKYNAVVPAHPGAPAVPAVCLFGAENPLTWKASFCDEAVDGGGRAKGCAQFCPRRTKEEVKALFDAELSSMDLPTVAFHYPDLAALMWVLDETEVDASTEDVPDQEPSTEPPVEEMKALPVLAEAPTVEPVERVLSTNNEHRPWWVRFFGGWRGR